MKLADAEKAEILKKFTDFWNEVHYDPEIESEFFPHYIIYKKISKKIAECYCTHCHDWFNAPVLNKMHGETGKCPECGYDITYLAEGYGRKRIYAKRNFVRFKSISDTEVIAIAINVRGHFMNPSCTICINNEDVALDYDYGICNLYYFTKGRAVRFKPEYNYVSGSCSWIETDAMREPIFEHNYMGMWADNNYTIMEKDMDVLRHSFLKYIVKLSENNDNLSSECTRTIDRYYLKYLALCSQRPNAEYLMSAGFSYIIDAYVSGTGLYGLRINWRSDNLNKMLGLAKNDIKLLRDHTIQDISRYKDLKKYFNNRASADQLIKCVELGVDKIKYICENTGLSLRNVLDYADNSAYSNRNHSRLRDWADYIEQCVKLEYNLNDTAISKPKNLNDAHERLNEIISYKEDELQNKMTAKRYKELQKLCFEDKKLGLKIVIPKTVFDIVNEGKRQNHCVGGYAKRHAAGELSIVFLRSIRKPDVPYYTMEISKEGTIVQCRGYRNNRTFDKPQKIKMFEEKYQEHLNILYKKKKNKKVGKTA